MTKLRFLVAVAGADLVVTPGDVVEMPEADAAKWADGVRAERVDATATGQPAKDGS